MGVRPISYLCFYTPSRILKGGDQFLTGIEKTLVASLVASDE